MRRGPLAACCLGVGALLATASPAPAATVSDRFADAPTNCGECTGSSTLIYRAEPGERNAVTVEPGPTAGVDDSYAVVRITDPGAKRIAYRPDLGCRPSGAGRIDCSVFLLDRVRIDLGDQDDRAEVSVLSALVDGGDGADEIHTGAGYDTVDGGLGVDRVRTGPGRDVLRDAGGDGDLLDGGGPRRARYLGDVADTLDLSSRRRGVRVDLRNHTLRSREERDRILSIENVVPGRGDDTVVGDSHVNTIAEDIEVAEAGFIGGKLLASGDDVLIGGGGRDELASLGGNDSLSGNAGNDRLECNYEQRQRCRLAGGAGNDLLTGSEGADRLMGGPGRDVLYSYEGDDVISARDGTKDRVDAGDGFDRARVDPRVDRVADVEARLP